MASKKEIERLKAKLEQAELVAQTIQIQVVQQGDLTGQLQVRLEFVESQFINIRIFQSQAMEIQNRVLEPSEVYLPR